MINEKETLLEQMKQQRFLPVTEDTFTLYRKYSSIIDPSNPDDIISLLFYEGEYYFRIGYFDKALNHLSRCIHAPKSDSLKIMEAKSYNLLGLIYGYLGQEVLAQHHLLEYLRLAQEYQYRDDIVLSYINLGVLNANLKDYDTALSYHQKAMDSLPDQTFSNSYAISACLCYQGTIHAKLGHMEKSAGLLDQVCQIYAKEESVIYSVPVLVLSMRIAYYRKNMNSFYEAFDQLQKQVSSDASFLDYSEYYFDLCDFLLEQGMPKEMRQLLNYIQTYVHDFPLVFLRYHILEYETAYAQKFCSDLEYMENAVKLIALTPEYEEEQRTAKLYSLEYIERVHQTRKLSDKLEEKSKLDAMTGLLNKYTIEFLISEYLNTKPREVISAVLLVDMDHFRQINDTLGHLTGDQIIADTASVIQRYFTESSLCGRIGGDEFLIFIQSVDDVSTLLLQAELLRQEIYSQTSERNLTITTQASIGIAFTSDTLNDYDKLFCAAEEALYIAKKDGRNKVFVTDRNQGMDMGA